jgi:hypothetical protein
MEFNIIAAAALVYLGVMLWKSMTSPNRPASRGRKASRPDSGPWEAGNNQRRGAR